MSLDKLALVFTMHKVGSSSVMQAFRSIGRLPERGFEENIDYLVPLSKYERVVTLVRDPIERNLSFLWENATLDPNYPLEFFDQVFKPTFGVDVYEHKFNRSKGYVIIDNHYLVIRTDKMVTQLGKAFTELFGLLEGTEVQVEHRAKTMAQRPDGKHYKDFISEAQFDMGYLDKMYDSKYAKHFFTAKEIERLRTKWMIKSG